MEFTRTSWKPNIGIHSGKAVNPKTFEQAYDHVLKNPYKEYKTRGGVPFNAKSSITTKGQHLGKKVIRFISRGQEMARSYPCCWGYVTNCNKTHIDIYTESI